MDARYARALTIAGSDSGGGAGIQADLKTFSALGCYGMSVITAVTAQNTLGVSGVHPIPISMVRKQIDAVLSDIGADAVKIGMLHSSESIECVASALSEIPPRNIVLDPVMVATSGDHLLQQDAIGTLRNALIPHVGLITPNIHEAEILLGQRIRNQEEFPQAIRALGKLGCPAVLLKAGHLDGSLLVDLLYEVSSGRITEYSAQRLVTENTHGTGCTLSSAICAGLARGLALSDAVAAGKAFLIQALREGAGFSLGAGHGPVHHFYAHWGHKGDTH